MSLPDDAARMQDDLAGLRRALHREPEIGLHLPRTQQKVLDALDGLPLEVRLGESLSSVTAVLRGQAGRGEKPTVLLRGDMDALPVAEQSDVPFRSEVDGAMHACGHDLHTSMLVGAARLLAARREQLAGDVVLMFQPGEEGWDGAGHMVHEGVLDASGRRAVAAYALHVTSNPWPNGVFVTRPGPFMAASDGLFVTVRGAGGHGSVPYRAADPVPAACEMVTALQTRLTRAVDPFATAVVTVGNLHAGTRRNIIPDTAVLEATVRTFSPAVREVVRRECVRVCEGIAAAHGLTADVRYEAEYPVTVNADTEAAFAAGVVAETFGSSRFLEPENPITGSEDFSRVLDRVPGAMVFLGAAPDGQDPRTAPDNHSPHATFDDGVLADGAALLARLAESRLAAPPP